MSFVRSVATRCDNSVRLNPPREGQVWPPSEFCPRFGPTGVTVSDAWAEAKEQGWHRNGNRTICPDCWELGAR